eukprot:7882488-Pyramimonas_sp.AAC.1
MPVTSTRMPVTSTPMPGAVDAEAPLEPDGVEVSLLMVLVVEPIWCYTEACGNHLVQPLHASV